MWKDHKKTIILTSVLTVLPILLGVCFWNQLPDVIATHFGQDGEPNGWSSKGFAVVGLPLFMLAIHLICILVTDKDPKYDRYPKKMKQIVLWICPIVSWIISVSTCSYELNWQWDILKCVNLAMGVGFVIIGNYLPKIKQNYFLGIKLPWTYASEDNWNKTHRLGGKVWFAGGPLLLLNMILKVKNLEMLIIVAMILIPTVYSYLYSRKESGKSSND